MGSYAAALQNKQDHANREWEDKYNDLRDAIVNTRQKLWNLQPPDPKATDEEKQQYEAAHAQGLQELTGAIQAYQDFLHPAKNPGVFERVKHLIGLNEHPLATVAQPRIASATQPGASGGTVDLGSGPVSMPATPSYKTSTVAPAPPPQDSTKKLYPSQLKDQAKRLHEAQQQALRMASSGPELPEAEAARKYEAQMKAQLDVIDRSGLSEPDKEEARRELFKIYQKPNHQVFDVPGVGPRIFDMNDPSSIPEGSVRHEKANVAATEIAEFNEAVSNGYSGSLPEWIAQQKASGGKGKFAWAKDENGRIYATLFNPLTNQEIPGSRNYSAVPPTSLLGRITTGHYHYTDANGLVHDVVQTSSSMPNSGGIGGSPAPSQPPSNGASPSPSASPHPKGGQASTVHSPAASGGPGKDHIIGFKGNKLYQDTKAALEGARERVETMDQNLVDAMKGGDNQQAMLSLLANHIGMTLGAQKGARINQAVWSEAIASAPWTEAFYSKMFHFDSDTNEYVFDGWKTGVTLTPDQMKQMVELAHQKEQGLEHAMARLDKEKDDAMHPNSSTNKTNSEQPKKHKIKVGNKFYTYKGTGDTADINNYDEVKQ